MVDGVAVEVEAVLSAVSGSPLDVTPAVVAARLVRGGGGLVGPSSRVAAVEEGAAVIRGRVATGGGAAVGVVVDVDAVLSGVSAGSRKPIPVEL